MHVISIEDVQTYCQLSRLCLNLSVLDASRIPNYTFDMQHRRLFILLLLFLASMAACSPGHVGGNEIAFLRGGHLWTIDPDGANAFEVFGDNSTPVVGYGWSPTHQILTFRTLDAAFAKTSAAKNLASNPITEMPGDLPTTLNTIGIDGGTPIPIIFSSPSVQNSNAWWNTSGSRLIYRQESTKGTPSPNTVLWWISQNDQPGGIARKLLPSSFSIPSFAPDQSRAIGNAGRGLFTTALDGTNVQYTGQNALPGHPLIATLERVLWQPAHNHPGILYAIAATATQARTSGATPIMVQLMLNKLNGQATILANCACSQFAWAPDGNHILYSTGSTYTVLNLTSGSSFSISGEDGSVPYWSPDSQFLLLDGLHSLTLIQLANQQQQVLLSANGTSTGAASQAAIPGVNALLQPASNSLWAADSRHFLFLTRGRLLWQGKHLNAGKGLYTVSIDGHGQPQGLPALVDTGNDMQAGWSYEDPNVSFLF